MIKYNGYISISGVVSLVMVQKCWIGDLFSFTPVGKVLRRQNEYSNRRFGNDTR